MTAMQDTQQSQQFSNEPIRSSFGVIAEIRDRRGVVRPQGEVDVATAPEVERQAVALWREGAETLELDLGGVTFFDSSGLRLLIRLQQQADEHPQRALELGDCSPTVRRVLELTRLDGRFRAARADG